MSDIIDNKPLPRISVITVVKNGKEFIRQTITSVVEQTYLNKEYIVVDGASTDGTVEIIKSFDSKIAKWISEKDRGIADAFNKGLAHATGDYILILNADDALAAPDILETVSREIISSDFPAMLYGDYNILNRRAGTIQSRGSVDFIPQKLRYGLVLPHPCLFTSRRYFEKYGNFDTSFRIAMDYEWMLRGALKERIIHVPILITNIRDGGISTRDQARVTKEIILALRKNGYFSGKLSEYRTRAYFLLRAASRWLLTAAGLYGAFNRMRNQRKSARYNQNHE